jgi:hypothetical protein
MTLSRVGTWLVALIIGVVFGVAGTIAQSATWGWFPVGILVAIIGACAIVLAVRLLTGDRWSALATGLGAMVATLLFSGRGPGGSVVVPAPADGELSTGVVWTIAVPIVVALVVAWPSTARGRPQPE